MASETTYEDLLRVKAQEENRRDLNDAIIGDETGKIRKHLPEQLTPAKIREKKEEEYRHQALTALMQLLRNNAEYAAQYKETMDLLLRAETASDALLIRFQNELDVTQTQMQAFKDTANRTSDGTIVFMDENGNVYDENNQLIEDPVLLASIVWKENAPSYEDYLKTQDKMTKLTTDIHDIRLYQIEVLAPAREKMTDENNPVTSDDMKKVQDDILKRAHPALKEDLHPSEMRYHEKPDIQQNTLEISVLKM